MKRTTNKDTSLKKVKQFIDSYELFYIIGHEKPDGDCIGSQLALAGLVTQLGKKSILLSAGPFNDFVVQTYQSLFYTSLDHCPHVPDTIKAAILCVDCSSPDRMGNVFDPIYHLPVAVIDHHTSGDNYGKVRYIDFTAPANTLLVYRLFKEYGITPRKEDAYFLFLGLLTDTGFFRFTRENNPEPFLTAAELTMLGVSAAEIYQQIGYGHTFLSRKIIAKVLERSKRVNNNRIIMSYLSHNDAVHLDDIPQTYEIYQLLQGTQKVEIVVYIQEVINDNGSISCKIGLRSLNKVDVGALAKHYGGGGHKNAAGFTITKTLDETWNELMEFFDSYKI